MLQGSCHLEIFILSCTKSFPRVAQIISENMCIIISAFFNTHLWIFKSHICRLYVFHLNRNTNYRKNYLFFYRKSFSNHALHRRVCPSKIFHRIFKWPLLSFCIIIFNIYILFLVLLAQNQLVGLNKLNRWRMVSGHIVRSVEIYRHNYVACRHIVKNRM